MTSGEGCSSSDARTDEGLRLGFTVGLSGFAALLYETVWIRLVGDVFGHTAYAVHTVLGLFFAGMALGTYYYDHVDEIEAELSREDEAASDFERRKAELLAERSRR